MNTDVNSVSSDWISKSQFRKHRNRLKKQTLNIVFNYSEIILSSAMSAVLNRGLNFCILPNQIDITQVLVDWKRFERTMIWIEFWYNRDCEEREEPVFKQKRNNLPQNYKSPDDLKTYLEAATWVLIDNKNRNKVKCNIPAEELKAIKELIQLQQDRKITIKCCDKGAGIIILDFVEYLRACYEHLQSRQTQENGETKPYYTKVNEATLTEAKSKIKSLIEEGFNNQILTKEEFESMDPGDKGPGKFYCTFKVHKPHIEGKAPPERPIISGSGSFTENPSLFIEHHIKHLGKQHPSFLEDTPHFLREIEAINKEGKLPENALLVTMDATALFINTPQEEGAQSILEGLNENPHRKVPPSFITRLLEILQEFNIFEFNGELWKQEIGSAMGQKYVPPYANNFMAKNIDTQIENIAKKYTVDGIIPLKF